ncbi:hypothetical protein BK735_06930 [Bacillus mycoides]|uniref:hypothetical protein n=1 Tax=Bacillus cereus group TaxID=86661 RepID=UPI000B43333A|nr:MULTISPECIES: hypothetical protein [Bacillus cereus group]OTY20621.1 hypothetical protein BK735_06930 [Bacillus mycoides]PHC97975.1 hypothetical protein COF44_21785 [Bacillus toyonensis]
MVETKPINKSDRLREFLLENFTDLMMESASGSNFEFPNFDLFARDYLQFAEHELLQLKKDEININHIHLINCVSHLRRAIDCHLDTCLYVLKIKVFRKKNLSVDQKLRFFRDAGVFNSFSFSRFNTIRNKMEHNYQIPKVSDIEAFFDLVSAFITVLESFLTSLHNQSEITLYTTNENSNIDVSFNIKYFYEDIPRITCEISNSLNWDKTEELTVTVNDEKDFPYFLKVLFLLARNYYFVRGNYMNKHILNELSK